MKNSGSSPSPLKQPKSASVDRPSVLLDVDGTLLYDGKINEILLNKLKGYGLTDIYLVKERK